VFLVLCWSSYVNSLVDSYSMFYVLNLSIVAVSVHCGSNNVIDVRKCCHTDLVWGIKTNTDNGYEKHLDSCNLNLQ